jgi:hypothetical protein
VNGVNGEGNNGSSRLWEGGLMMAPLAPDPIVVEGPVYRGRSHFDTTLLLRQLVELLESSGKDLF